MERKEKMSRAEFVFFKVWGSGNDAIIEIDDRLLGHKARMNMVSLERTIENIAARRHEYATEQGWNENLMIHKAAKMFFDKALKDQKEESESC